MFLQNILAFLAFSDQKLQPISTSKCKKHNKSNRFLQIILFFLVFSAFPARIVGVHTWPARRLPLVTETPTGQERQKSQTILQKTFAFIVFLHFR